MLAVSPRTPINWTPALHPPPDSPPDSRLEMEGPVAQPLAQHPRRLDSPPEIDSAFGQTLDQYIKEALRYRIRPRINVPIPLERQTELNGVLSHLTRLNVSSLKRARLAATQVYFYDRLREYSTKLDLDGGTSILSEVYEEILLDDCAGANCQNCVIWGQPVVRLWDVEMRRLKKWTIEDLAEYDALHTNYTEWRHKPVDELYERWQIERFCRVCWTMRSSNSEI